jgi:hypothetical protein
MILVKYGRAPFIIVLLKAEMNFTGSVPVVYIFSKNVEAISKF